MRDYSLLAAQVRAARAILGWSQTYLARGANVTKNTIVDFETNRRVPHDITLMVVLDQLTAAGIDLTPDGVKVREWPLKPYIPVGLHRNPAPVASGKIKPKSIKNLGRHGNKKKL